MSLKLLQNTVQGRIAIGEKHVEKGYPVKLDYFIATHPFDPKSKTAPRHKKMMELFKEKYKTDKTKVVDVILIDHHPEEAFFTNYMNYPNNLCNCRGDGETALRNLPDGKKESIQCDYDNCKFRWAQGAKGLVNTCKPTGILTFIIPDAPSAGGVWRFTTHSMMTIGKINGALQKIYQIRNTLRGLKVRLRVVMVSIKIDGKQQNVPTVELEIPFSYNEIAAGAGTAIGTLEEARQQYLSMGAKPNPVRMQELSHEAEKEGYDGSDPVIPASEIINAEIVDDIPQDSTDELSF